MAVKKRRTKKRHAISGGIAGGGSGAVLLKLIELLPDTFQLKEVFKLFVPGTSVVLSYCFGLGISYAVFRLTDYKLAKLGKHGERIMNDPAAKKILSEDEKNQFNQRILSRRLENVIKQVDDD